MKPRRPGRPYRPGLDDPRYHAAREQLKKIDHTCHRCGFPIDTQLKWPHPLSWSFDHKIPRSKLTPDDYRNWDISNGIAAHLRCNESRGNKPLDQPKPLPLDPSIDW